MRVAERNDRRYCRLSKRGIAYACGSSLVQRIGSDTSNQRGCMAAWGERWVRRSCPHAPPQAWGCEAVEHSTMWLGALCRLLIGPKPPRRRINHATRNVTRLERLAAQADHTSFGCIRPVALGLGRRGNPTAWEVPLCLILFIASGRMFALKFARRRIVVSEGLVGQRRLTAPRHMFPVLSRMTRTVCTA